MRDDVKLFVIQALRPPIWGESVRDLSDRLRKAADLIESLAAELEQVKQERDGLNILLGQAQSMLETRTRERDAAVEDLRTKAYYCETCAHYTPGYFCSGCRNKSNWQWRGAKE